MPVPKNVKLEDNKLYTLTCQYRTPLERTNSRDNSKFYVYTVLLDSELVSFAASQALHDRISALFLTKGEDFYVEKTVSNGSTVWNVRKASGTPDRRGGVEVAASPAQEKPRFVFSPKEIMKQAISEAGELTSVPEIAATVVNRLYSAYFDSVMLEIHSLGMLAVTDCSDAMVNQKREDDLPF